MSQSSYDAPTGPIRSTAPGAAPQPPPADRADGPGRRRNIRRDLTAAALLVIAAFLPWNLYFGVGVPNSTTVLFAVLAVATLLSLVAIAAPAGRLRLLLNVPYWLLVLGFIGFDVFETIRFGGSVHVPGGVGPGAWLGLAGSILGAQQLIARPAPDDDRPDGWLRTARIIGYASLLAATLSTGFNLFWRVWFGMDDTTGTGFGKKNIAVIVTAVVYGLVQLIGVLVASRWLTKNTKAAHLAIVGLGSATLVAGILVWFLPVGRDIDAFHGIAQNTSTAGVGFEGYLAWAAGAAIFAPRVLAGYRRGTPDPWRMAARHGLTLITVWCLGSVLMRITAFAVAVALDYPYSRYDTMTMIVFDLATAVLAFWLRRKLADGAGSQRLISSLCGLVVTFSAARIAVGVMLAPRFAEVPGAETWRNPVYGNNLAQQITSTFDVALAVLALGVLIAARITAALSGRRRRRRRRPPAHTAHPAPAAPAQPSSAATTRVPTGGAGPAPQLAGSGSPRIFRGDDSATRQIRQDRPAQGPAPKIYRPPQDSG